MDVSLPSLEVSVRKLVPERNLITLMKSGPTQPFRVSSSEPVECSLTILLPIIVSDAAMVKIDPSPEYPKNGDP